MKATLRDWLIAIVAVITLLAACGWGDADANKEPPVISYY